MARTDICVGFRVARNVVEAFINSTFNNSSEGRKSLIENLIAPEAKMYANAINQDLFALVDKSSPLSLCLRTCLSCRRMRTIGR